MKRFGIGLVAATLFALPAFAHAASPGAMRVSLIDGDVQVRIPETGEWEPASINMPLVEDDELWVPDGDKAEIFLSNGTCVRLGGGTGFQVLRADAGSFQFSLTQGGAYVFARGPKRSVVQFDTPSTSVRAYGRAVFRIDIPDTDTDISVYKGSVVAESGDGGTTQVTAGNTLTLGQDGYAELSPLGPADDWEEWNSKRDQRFLARREGSRYLPDELRAYASDFDDNGRWVRDDEYGYVWTPTVLVVSDWAPYRHGRWVWHGGDYIWISFEPWGWAPYHYGRWAFRPRHGWCWVPPERGQVYWAPGYVAWVSTGDHVAWVPLAPREIYYGHGNYGRYSVNITNVNIANIRVTNVYRNVTVVNAVTVVNRTTFVTGRPVAVDRNVEVRVRQDFQERRNIVVGRPEIRPTTSYAPVTRVVPEAKRPPARVREVRIEPLRQGRPLVREPDRSVIRPGAVPRSLEVKRSEAPKTFRERGKERQVLQPSQRRDAGKPSVEQPAVRPGTPAGRPERRIEKRTREQALPTGPGGAERGRPPQAQPAEKVTPPPEQRPDRPVRGREREVAPTRPAPAQIPGPQPAPAPPAEKASPPPDQRPDRPARGREREVPPTRPAPAQKPGPQPAPAAPAEKASPPPDQRPDRPARGREREVAPTRPAPAQKPEPQPAPAPPAEKVTPPPDQRPDRPARGREREVAPTKPAPAENAAPARRGTPKPAPPDDDPDGPEERGQRGGGRR